MVEQKKRTTQSAKIEPYLVPSGARLIWKQQIWLVLTKPYCLVTNQRGEFCE